jgi:hypothetical protein
MHITKHFYENNNKQRFENGVFFFIIIVHAFIINLYFSLSLFLVLLEQ